MKKTAVLLLALMLCFSAYTQETHVRKLDWKYKSGEKVTPESEKKPWFREALAMDDTELPFYCERFPLPAGATQAGVRIANADFELLSSAENEYVASKEAKRKDLDVNYQIQTERGKNYVFVYFRPFVFDPAAGKYRKLLGFSLILEPQGITVPLKQKSWTFAAHSVLATGSWHKMGVSYNGIYKLTYGELQTMGVPVDAIDPRNIRIYGNGGAMLPENNAEFRYDDLQENAIFVAGESDGRFDPQDYILFYGDGVVRWVYESGTRRFIHQLNKYSTGSYYFLNTDIGPGKRLATQVSLTQSPDFTVTTFDDYLVHESDSLNLIKSGREFYGEVFDIATSYEWTFNIPNIVTGSPVRYRTNVLGRVIAPYSSTFDHYINGSKILTSSISPVPPSYTSIFADTAGDTAIIVTNSPVNLRINYNKGSSSTSKGWLDYFELNFKRNLIASTGHMAFRNAESVNKGVTEFILGNATGFHVWNVTDPLNAKVVSGNLSGSDLMFRLLTDTLMEFVAHNGTSYFSVQPAGRVSNQDLHGLGQTDMVILTHSDFEGQANALADLHRTQDGLSVVVLKPEMVYNEFSSGKQDPTAIRSLMKMFYDRAGGNPDQMPLYLLLFGDGSYDNLNRLQGNTNYMITYQTTNSLAPTASYATDDYYGFLDDHESGPYGGNLDIGIGRLPAKSAEEAQNMVDKIIRYCSPTDLNAQSAVCGGFNADISNFGDWRNVLCFIADDSDLAGENFLGESESIATKVDTTVPTYNIDKIYCDAYIQVSSPGGQRYPDVNDAIVKRVEKGALIINYIGHGGETGWAHEQILTVSMINSFENKYNMPLFVTATCEFSRFDDPERTSAGEYVLLNPNGGGIALFTTTRLAFSGSNYQLNSRFYNYAFNPTDEPHYGLGDIVRNAKNAYGCASVIANFCLLGDPAMSLAYTRHRVVTTHINNHPVVPDADTMRAFSKVTVRGEIRNKAGVKLDTYSGLLFPTVFDKKMTVTSRGNDAGSPQNFKTQTNIIYKGKVSIIGGDFSFTFLVPKDIAYQFGRGKISYYGKDASSDAGGWYNEFIIGGTETSQITDKEGPDIELYLNDERFVSGGMTNPNPFLLAKVSDTSGINTVGSGIGHDIAAVLDGNNDKTYVLNDYYESDLNTYQSGVVRYPFKNLATGNHILNLKVWDIFNNSAERSVDFVVAESATLALDHVLNYPNPFTTYTEFWFEHNKPCCGLDVQVQIFTISGKLIKTISTYVQTNGFRADPIPWDGLDEYGDHIGKGVYLYKLRAKDDQGSYAEKIEKLVILR